jgi:hypothetical protein
VYRADPNEVRAELLKILAEARAARMLPWQPGKVAFYRTVFPQMANWLPIEEANQLRYDFDTGLARLGSRLRRYRCGSRLGQGQGSSPFGWSSTIGIMPF